MVANYTEATALPHKMIEKEATQEHRCPFPDCKFLFFKKVRDGFHPNESIILHITFASTTCVKTRRFLSLMFVINPPAGGAEAERANVKQSRSCKNTKLDVPVVWETCQENCHLCQKHWIRWRNVPWSVVKRYTSRRRRIFLCFSGTNIIFPCENRL